MRSDPLLGDRAGQRTARLVRPEDARADEPAAVIAGLNVHAKVAIPAGDRPRLERLCRHLARPPIAQERLELLAGGLRYEMKRPCRDGTHAVVLEPPQARRPAVRPRRRHPDAEPIDVKDHRSGEDVGLVVDQEAPGLAREPIEVGEAGN